MKRFIRDVGLRLRREAGDHLCDHLLVGVVGSDVVCCSIDWAGYTSGLARLFHW